MRNNSFKAWMWGRVLSAADSMNDVKAITQAKSKLSPLLEQQTTEEDNFAFFTWAWGYRAAVSQKKYETFSKKMIDDSMQLTKKYKEGPRDHSALSDALWAWVMDLLASANAGDEHNYAFIKDQIKDLIRSDSITKVLETGLLRTSQSNDYPAWVLAKIRFAAAMMGDKELYQDTEKSLLSSIEGAKQAGTKAEYILSVLENQLAMLAGKKLQSEIDVQLKW